MTKIHELHRRWSKDADYKNAYDGFGEEFDLARTLIEARAAAGLSQSQLARRMKTSQSYIARSRAARCAINRCIGALRPRDPDAPPDRLRARARPLMQPAREDTPTRADHARADATLKRLVEQAHHALVGDRSVVPTEGSSDNSKRTRQETEPGQAKSPFLERCADCCLVGGGGTISTVPVRWNGQGEIRPRSADLRPATGPLRALDKVTVEICWRRRAWKRISREFSKENARNGGGGGSRAGKARPKADADLPDERRRTPDRAKREMVEAAGVEPASESTSPWDSTCVSASDFSCPA